jgi:hypothetical protein
MWCLVRSVRNESLGDIRVLGGRVVAPYDHVVDLIDGNLRARAVTNAEVS